MRALVLVSCLLVACGARSGLELVIPATGIDAGVARDAAPREDAVVPFDAPVQLDAGHEEIDAGVELDCDGVGRWVAYDGPTTEDLFGVVVVSPNDAWITGAHGTILHWDGARWMPVATDTAEDVGPIWVDAVNGLAIAGRSILRRSGDRWRSEAGPSIPRESIFSAVWGRASDDVWLGGGTAGPQHEELWHWNGSIWERHASPVVDIQVVALRGSARDRSIWMTGHLGRVARLVGTDWERLPDPPGEVSSRVWGVSADEAWAAAGHGEVHHWRAGAWERFVTVDEVTYFYAIWGSSSADVWALGYQGSAVHYDGAAWSRIELPTDASMFAIDGSCMTSAWAVGENGTILRLVP